MLPSAIRLGPSPLRRTLPTAAAALRRLGSLPRFPHHRAHFGQEAPPLFGVFPSVAFGVGHRPAEPLPAVVAYPLSSRQSGPQVRGHDHDLHPRPQPRYRRRPQPFRPVNPGPCPIFLPTLPTARMGPTEPIATIPLDAETSNSANSRSPVPQVRRGSAPSIALIFEVSFFYEK
jgi:hypothetical protein